jgi:outer membrane protein assembly factor BamE (lipoprotein component of BamABCDE complex)
MIPKIVIAILLGAVVFAGCTSKQSRIQKIQSQYPQWDEATVEKVATTQVEIGMTQEMVRVSLGKPDAVTQEGGEEKWGYAIMIVPAFGPHYEKFVYFVYFREGKVVRTTGDLSRLNYLHWKR